MAIDASIPLQVQQYQPMQSLSNVLNIANNAQNLQRGALGLQNEQRTTDERGHIAGVLSKIKDYMGPDGTVDKARLHADLLAGAPTTGSDAMQHVENAEQAGAQATQAISNLSETGRTQVANYLNAFKNKPIEVIQSGMQALQSQAPFLSPAIKLAQSQLANIDPKNPDALNAAIDTFTRAVQPAPTQQAMLTPTPLTVNNGQRSMAVNIKPGASVPEGGVIPGSVTQAQPAPTTPVIGPDGKPRMYGAQPDMKVGASGPQVTYAPGEQEGITGPVATNNAHYSDVQQAAKVAPGRIAALQTIKQQVPDAITGGGGVGDFLRSVSRVFGFANDSATANDVMAKNLAVLASQNGNTDAARSLGEMANPSYHMTEKAAIRAADQLVGIAAKDQAAGTFFANTPTNSPDYTNKMTMWNKYGDPRAFEFAAKSPKEQAEMKAEMVKAGTWKTLQDNMRHLHMMGVEPQ